MKTLSAETPKEPFDENELYHAKEVGYFLGMSTEWTRRRFLHEPGVLVIPSSRPGGRIYRSLRIPGLVAKRVWRKLRNGFSDSR